jgi:acyl carrier protein
MNDTKLKKAFEKGLGIPENSPFETLEFAKSDHWDSIAHMKLIAAIEEEFDIRLDVNDILGLSSYLVARDLITKHMEKPE